MRERDTNSNTTDSIRLGKREIRNSYLNKSDHIGELSLLTPKIGFLSNR